MNIYNMHYSSVHILRSSHVLQILHAVLRLTLCYEMEDTHAMKVNLHKDKTSSCVWLQRPLGHAT